MKSLWFPLHSGKSSLSPVSLAALRISAKIPPIPSNFLSFLDFFGFFLVENLAEFPCFSASLNKSESSLSVPTDEDDDELVEVDPSDESDPFESSGSPGGSPLLPLDGVDGCSSFLEEFRDDFPFSRESFPPRPPPPP